MKIWIIPIMLCLFASISFAAIDDYYATHAVTENALKLPQANVDGWISDDSVYGSMDVDQGVYGYTENYDASGSDIISKVRLCWQGYYTGTYSDDETRLIWYFDGDAENTVFTLTTAEGSAGSPFEKCYDITSEKGFWNWADVQNVNMKALGVKNGGPDNMVYYGDSNYIEVTHAPPLGFLSINLNQPVADVNVDASDTFTLNGTITCDGVVAATCGTVQLTARYGNPNPVTTMTGATALRTTGNPKSCGAMIRGNSCSAEWTVTANQQGTYYVDVQASSTDVPSNDTLNREVVVNPPPVPPAVFAVSISSPSASSFLLNTTIEIVAQVTYDSTAFADATVSMAGACTGALTYTGSNGNYNASCTLLELGDKAITVTAQNGTDQSQDIVNFTVKESSELSLEILEPEQDALFERGGCADIIAHVVEGTTPLVNSLVIGNTSTGMSFDMMQDGTNHTLKYCFGSEDPSPFTFYLTGIAEVDDEEQEATAELTVKLKSIKLDVFIYDEAPYFVGDEIKPIIEIKYENGEFVSGASVTGLLQGRQITFEEMTGFYSPTTPYYVSVNDEISGELSLSIQATDSQDNSGSGTATIDVQPSDISYQLELVSPTTNTFCFNQPVDFMLKAMDLNGNTQDDLTVLAFYHKAPYLGTSLGNGTYLIGFNMPATAESEIDFVAANPSEGKRSENIVLDIDFTNQLELGFLDFKENATVWAENYSLEIMIIYPDGTPASGDFTVEIENRTFILSPAYCGVTEYCGTAGLYGVTLNLTNLTYGTQVLNFTGQDAYGNVLNKEIQFTYSAGGPIDIFVILIMLIALSCILIFIGLFSRLYGTVEKKQIKRYHKLKEELGRIEKLDKDAHYQFYKRVIDDTELKKRVLKYKQRMDKIKSQMKSIENKLPVVKKPTKTQ